MKHHASFLVVLAVLSSFAGCSDQGDRPDIGQVTGIVTLDGKPLPNASVSFIQSGVRPSVGETDNEGRYELIYLRDIKGAAVGEHLVKVKLFGQGKNRLPRKYNSESELTREVKPGSNEFNLDLKSGS